jgi:LCP family protein required for cell wall assembly
MPRTRALPVVRRPTDNEDDFGGSGGSQRPVSAPGRGRPRIRRRLALVLLLLVAWAGFTVYAPIHAWGGVARVDDSPSGDRPSDGDGHDYLLVGSDSREGLTAQEIKNLGTGGVKGNEGRRTDSIILVHVPGGGGKKVLISIPRDSYVPIPGHGSNKINAAYSIGGPKLLIQTIERVTDVHIDGYLEIGFGGFAKLVDAMGGVNICVPFDMDDAKAHINLKKGCQDLDGKNALGFVRARYSDPRGDIGRAQRQRQFLGAIMKKMATPSTVLIPTRWWATSHNAVAGLNVGDDTSVWDAYRIVSAMRGVSSEETLSLVVPIADAGYQTPAGSSVKWDSARARELFRMLAEDVPIDSPPAGTDGKPSGG